MLVKLTKSFWLFVFDEKTNAVHLPIGLVLIFA